MVVSLPEFLDFSQWQLVRTCVGQSARSEVGVAIKSEPARISQVLAYFSIQASILDPQYCVTPTRLLTFFSEQEEHFPPPVGPVSGRRGGVHAEREPTLRGPCLLELWEQPIRLALLRLPLSGRVHQFRKGVLFSSGESISFQFGLGSTFGQPLSEAS